MKIVARIIAAMLFVLFFGFALKNAHEVSLKFFMDYEWHGPLVLLLLAFFVAGAAFGVLAMTPTVFRHRREISRQKIAIGAMQKEGEAQQTARSHTPRADGVTN